ncbi:ornithine cyclodeaminase family protein [Streptomyces sp. NPDC001828]|uniref:ornithine cyclodeaminase family protein n=1 Tax=Streptomyces sp. NPDC001828 TaxID=3364615 RepID=UPI003686579D
MTAAGPTADPAPAPSGPGPGRAVAARPLLHLTEEQTAAHVDEELALEAARAAFAATVGGTVLPGLAVHGSDPRNRFTLKPSASATHAGVKDTAERGERTAAALAARGYNSRGAGAEEACSRADVVVTVTTARVDTPPLFDAAWIRPGTHVSCMGADAPGKRELPPELFARARVFCDLPEQARRMGESQHAPAGTVLTPLGEVLIRRVSGRRDDSDITVFDSSGIGVQDLYLGLALLKKMDISL